MRYINKVTIGLCSVILLFSSTNVSCTLKKLSSQASTVAPIPADDLLEPDMCCLTPPVVSSYYLCTCVILQTNGYYSRCVDGEPCTVKCARDTS